MEFYGDYHTHSYFSDAGCSVRAVVEAAKSRGLKEVAVTDHGFRCKYLALTPAKFARQGIQIEKIRTEYPDIKIFHGIEADIQDFNGTVDITPEQADKLDILLAGFHRFVHGTSVSGYFDFIARNGFRVKEADKKLIRRNTEAFIKAIEKYPIDILTHINHRAAVDVRAVCEAAAEYGTLIEINMKHFDLIDKNFDEMLKTDCKFIVDSDAHRADCVGEFGAITPLIRKYGLDGGRVVNLGRAPVFTRLNAYKKQRKNNGQA